MIKTLLFIFLLFIITPSFSQFINYPSDITSDNVKSYGAKGDGITDDTRAIQDAMDANRKGVDTKGKLDYFYAFPKTVFFPKGVYLISDKLTWTGQSIMMIGNGKGQTIIRLKPSSPKFSNPLSPLPMIETQDGIHQFRNYIRDMTIKVGSNNPGAIGIDFVANNSGGIVNVEITSEDTSGIAGIILNRYAPGPLMIRDLIVKGFDYGIKVDKTEYSLVLENVFLLNQKVAGLYNNNNILTIRKLNSTNLVPAIKNVGRVGMITLLKSNLNGGLSTNSAIENEGELFARDVYAIGYQSVIKNKGVVVNGTYISEYTSTPASKLFSSGSKSLNLPVGETPNYNHGNLKDWGRLISPNYGDNSRWQSTINSGKSVIYLTAGRYMAYNRLYTIPLTVRKIIGFGAIINTGDRYGMRIKIVDGDENSPPLIIEHIGYGLSIEHISKRPVVIKRCKIQGYINNPSSGKLYLEDVEMHGSFTFHPQQKVWARQWNNEKDTTRIVNKGADVWILGLKTERKGTVIKTTDCGRTELLGGFLYPVKAFTNEDHPAFINIDSQHSIICGGSSFITNGMYPSLIQETIRGVTREIRSLQTQGRTMIPLHLGVIPCK